MDLVRDSHFDVDFDFDSNLNVVLDFNSDEDSSWYVTLIFSLDSILIFMRILI